MRRIIIGMAILLALSYALFESRRLLAGPDIRIDFPQDGSATSSPIVTVAGIAENISFLTINDAPSYTDEAGKFVYRFSPPPGYTVVTVAAVDRFGRSTTKSISITVVEYCPA